MYIHRLAEKTVSRSFSNLKIVILLGARQVGKTTLIEPFVREKQGVLLNCDISVDKARLLAASTLPPQDAMKLFGSPPMLVIDEAQNLPEIGRIVKGWYDAHVSAKIFLLGSSSLNLLSQTAEPLTGRNEKIYLTPLLFSEMLQSQSWYTPQLPKPLFIEQFSSQLQTLLLTQMVYGAYPETAVSDDKEKYLLNLTSDYLLRDILQSGLVKSPETVKKLLQLLAYQAGSEVSVNELASSLQISRQTIERYIELLERSYVIFRVRAFNTNQRKEISKNTKIFFWDTGVRNALLKEFSLTPTRSDIGSLFENWVVSEAAKQNLIKGDRNTIYFWRKRDGGEVDLVIKGTDTLKAYEIKWSKKSTASSIRSFTDIYHVPVAVLTKNTIFDFLLQEFT